MRSYFKLDPNETDYEGMKLFYVVQDRNQSLDPAGKVVHILIILKAEKIMLSDRTGFLSFKQ